MIFCFSEMRFSLPFLDYFVNYDYISKVLCINKDKPALNCKGKCYLMRQLKEAQDDKNRDHNKKTIELERTPMIVNDPQLPKLRLIYLDIKKNNCLYQFSIKDLNILPPTPPPKLKF